MTTTPIQTFGKMIIDGRLPNIIAFGKAEDNVELSKLLQTEEAQYHYVDLLEWFYTSLSNYDIHDEKGYKTIIETFIDTTTQEALDAGYSRVVTREITARIRVGLYWLIEKLIEHIPAAYWRYYDLECSKVSPNTTFVLKKKNKDAIEWLIVQQIETSRHRTKRL